MQWVARWWGGARPTHVMLTIIASVTMIITAIYTDEQQYIKIIRLWNKTNREERRGEKKKREDKRKEEMSREETCSGEAEVEFPALTKKILRH